MNQFKPFITEFGVSVEDGTWPAGIVQDQFLLVEGAWKQVRTGSDGRVFFHDAPEITSFAEAQSTLHTIWRRATERAARA